MNKKFISEAKTSNVKATFYILSNKFTKENLY